MEDLLKELQSFIGLLDGSQPAIIFGACGAFGALARELLDNDGSIVLPTRTKNVLKLGSFYGIIIGAFVGFVVDSSSLKAVLAGFLWASIVYSIKSFFDKKKSQ